MSKLKGLLLTEGMHGMISQVVGLAKALIKDAIHLIKSSYPEEIRVDKQNIIDGESEYILPYF